jgi:hypothetical protein
MGMSIPPPPLHSGTPRALAITDATSWVACGARRGVSLAENKRAASTNTTLSCVCVCVCMSVGVCVYLSSEGEFVDNNSH